jgi:hypothetical protein
VHLSADVPTLRYLDDDSVASLVPISQISVSG